MGLIVRVMLRRRGGAVRGGRLTARGRAEPESVVRRPADARQLKQARVRRAVAGGELWRPAAAVRPRARRTDPDAGGLRRRAAPGLLAAEPTVSEDVVANDAATVENRAVGLAVS